MKTTDHRPQTADRTHVAVFGTYTADDLQRAMRVVLARADLRRLRSRTMEGAALSAPCSFDVRPDGRLVPV